MKKTSIVLLFIIISMISFAQQIVQVEYYIDNDPGFGNAISVPISPDSVLNGISFNADLTNINSGLHSLYVRSKDANGHWSLTTNQFIYKFPSPINNNILPLIYKVEYFIDTDPGFGNATNIPISSDSLINAFSFNVNFALIPEGLHLLVVRSRDVNGNWSLSRNQYFYKFPSPINNDILPAITRLEYFLDTDPGFGNATNIPITSDSIISNFIFNADINSLTEGIHVLYVRSQDANGKWSLTRSQYIYKFPAPLNNDILPSISKLEYFIDTDPGFGNATNIPVISDSIISSFMFNANISSLSEGMHVLNIRSQDANGKWSLTRSQYIYKFPAPLNNDILPLITKLEYFIDTDPGFGNATNIPVTSDSIISNFMFNSDISSLSEGIHVLNIRSKDANGKWSLTQPQYIYKFPAPLNNDILPSITKLEYYIDIDPGFGNATNIPVTSDSIISNFMFNADISALIEGIHVLYVRSKDANGKWSLTRPQYIYKFPAPLNNDILPLITKLEYFFDTDPGFGNANSITITPDSILNSISFNASTSSLSPGIHVLSVRSKDEIGNWSLTRNQPIYKFPPPINNDILQKIVRIEYFVDTDPGFGNAINLPCSSDSSINNLIFSIDTTNLSLGAHTLSVRSLDSMGKWSLTANTRFSRNQIKLFLQGYYVGNNIMAPVLMNEGIGSDLGLTDSITIELHNPTYPYALKESVKTLLYTDGSVHCSFTTGIGSYYIVIKHRNSIETWCNAPVNIGANSNTYDFATAANKAYGSKQKQLGSGVYGIYTGDINQDDNIDLLDAQLLENEIEAFSYGYISSDLNGDGNVDLVDLPLEEINISSFIFSSRP